jgi:hypothetical protein
MIPPRTASLSNRAPRWRQASLALAALVLLGVGAPARGASLVSLDGDVEIGAGEPPAWRDAREGDALAPGDRVRTGRDGRAEIALDGATIRLYPSSVLRLPAGTLAAGEPEAVDLERGSSLFDVLRRDAAPFEVRSPEVVVSVKGTRFGVDLTQAAAAVAVFRGTVGVRGSVSDLVGEVLVREGFAAVAGGERGFDLLLHSGDDPWGAWAAGAVVPELLGHDRPQPPANAALEDARAAAQRAADPEVLVRAAERRPEVAERIATLAREQENAPDPKAVRGSAGVVDAQPKAPHGVDPLLDGARGRELRGELREDFVEATLGRGPNGGGTGGAGGAGLSIDVIQQSGSSFVQVEGSNFTTLLSPGQIENVLSSGNASTLPTPLLQELASKNIDPIFFAQQIGGLLNDTSSDGHP